MAAGKQQHTGLVPYCCSTAGKHDKRYGLWFTASNTAWQAEGADPDHGYEAALAGNSGSGGTQGSTDSSLQAGPKAGPVGDDPLIARHLCLDALQHLSHQRSNVRFACEGSSWFRLHVLHKQDLCINSNTKRVPTLGCIAVEAACSLKLGI